jgi:hypothetical protein
MPFSHDLFAHGTKRDVVKHGSNFSTQPLTTVEQVEQAAELRFVADPVPTHQGDPLTFLGGTDRLFEAIEQPTDVLTTEKLWFRVQQVSRFDFAPGHGPIAKVVDQMTEKHAPAICVAKGRFVVFGVAPAKWRRPRCEAVTHHLCHLLPYLGIAKA